MRVRDLFDEIAQGNLTTLEKVTFVEKATEGYEPEKLKLLKEDLQQMIAVFQKRKGADAISELFDGFYESFRESYQDNEVLMSISKEQLLHYLVEHPDRFQSEKMIDLLKQSMENGIHRHGEPFAQGLLGLIELTFFEKLIDEKLRQVEGDNNTTLPAGNKSHKGGRKATYQLEDTRRWWNELRSVPEYQHPNGSPNIGAIDAELISRHKVKTGQKPSFATIKNHRRTLGFMQK